MTKEFWVVANGYNYISERYYKLEEAEAKAESMSKDNIGTTFTVFKSEYQYTTMPIRDKCGPCI